MVDPTRIATSPSVSRIGGWPYISVSSVVDQLVQVLLGLRGIVDAGHCGRPSSRAAGGRRRRLDRRAGCGWSTSASWSGARKTGCCTP